MDEAIRRWKQKGQIFFWLEADRRQGEGWHLAADLDGCNDLDDIIRLSRSAAYPSRFEFVVATNGGARRALVLSVDRSWPADHWHLVGGEVTKLELGIERLCELEKVAADLRAQKGDYTFGPDKVGQSIWVWWPPR